ncbi:MAG TPA: hypothetical protein VFC39_20190, partial [Acidobacteriaceae bacterium]|nr:hypothetical protein [Acidobacteriaceae bacterium]
LDWLIPLSQSHLRWILTSWMDHYNQGRPHMALGPGVPDPPSEVANPRLSYPGMESADACCREANRYSAACIMSIRWRPHSADWVFADHSSIEADLCATEKRVEH